MSKLAIDPSLAALLRGGSEPALVFEGVAARVDAATPGGTSAGPGGAASPGAHAVDTTAMVGAVPVAMAVAPVSVLTPADQAALDAGGSPVTALADPGDVVALLGARGQGDTAGQWAAVERIEIDGVPYVRLAQSADDSSVMMPAAFADDSPRMRAWLADVPLPAPTDAEMDMAVPPAVAPVPIVSERGHAAARADTDARDTDGKQPSDLSAMDSDAPASSDGIVAPGVDLDAAPSTAAGEPSPPVTAAPAGQTDEATPDATLPDADPAATAEDGDNILLGNGTGAVVHAGAHGGLESEWHDEAPPALAISVEETTLDMERFRVDDAVKPGFEAMSTRLGGPILQFDVLKAAAAPVNPDVPPAYLRADEMLGRADTDLSALLGEPPATAQVALTGSMGEHGLILFDFGRAGLLIEEPQHFIV